MSHSSADGQSSALFVDVPTAARMLSLGLTTVWSMVRAGQIPSRRFRRAVRIPRAAIERLASEQIDVATS
jgi:excisionase family DNA binding protein